MSIRLELPKVIELKPRITVIGVGGAGGNAVNNMIAAGLDGVEFVVANTDAQALASSSAELRIQLGSNLTEGLGAGSKPEIGEAAAEEAADEIRGQIAGSHMVFIAAGMGGGTGTGAAGVIARIAKELDILVVAIVTKPFQFEGARRMRMAEAGIAALRANVDTMIVIPNQNLFRVATERTTFAEAFVLADQVLYSGIACIVDLIVKEGLINLDFADVRTVLSEMGSAVMGTGEASGERRAVLAAEEAISNPLLDDVSLQGARGLLLSIIGGRDLTLYEVDEAASRVRKEVDPEANIIVGATFDDTLEDRVRVSIVASGMEARTSAPTVEAMPSPRAPAPPHATGGPTPVTASEHLVTRAAPAPAAVAPPPPILPPPPAPAASAGPPPASGIRRFDELPRMAVPAPVQTAAALAPAPVLRAPSQREADDYARAMTAAYEQPAAAPHADPSVWENDGVTIEEALAPLGQPHRSAIPPPLPRSPRVDTASTPPFQAQQPAELRRPPRRMPELADFPEVAQRDFRAKAPTSPERGGLPSPPVTRSGAEPATRRKQGLFERLSSFARREPDADHAGTDSAGRAEKAGHGNAQPGQGPRRGAHDDPEHRSAEPGKPHDLPEFFDHRR